MRALCIEVDLGVLAVTTGGLKLLTVEKATLVKGNSSCWTSCVRAGH